MHRSVRSEADAKRLQAEFGDFFTPLIMDITDEAAVRRAAAEVKGLMKGRTLMGLVNNAGQFLPGDRGDRTLCAACSFVRCRRCAG